MNHEATAQFIAAIKKDPGPIPELKPPWGEIAAPSIDHAVLVGALWIAFLVLLAGRYFRRELTVVAPPDLPHHIANRKLDVVAEGEPVKVAETAAQIVRSYVVEAFHLGPEALTNTEVWERFHAHGSSDEDTRARLFVFFRDCDVMRFAPGEADSSFDPISSAREVISLLEWKRSGQMNPSPETAAL